MDEKLEIQKQNADVKLRLVVSGRIDSYWADQLANSIKEEVDSGNYNIILNLSNVKFISSAAIRVFLTYYRQLSKLNGSLVIEEPSEGVEAVLKLSGLTQLFSAAPIVEPHKEIVITQVSDNIKFTIHELNKNGKINYKFIYNPETLAKWNFTEKDLHSESFSSGKFALGLGAIGSDFEDCKPRFGESLALGGAVTFMPTDGTKKPDYLYSSGNYIPELKLLYGMVFEGEFSKFIKFENKDESTPVTLENLVKLIIEKTGYKNVLIAIAGQTHGMVGASIIKSPLQLKDDKSLFDYPEIMDNINFTTEREFPKALALCLGAAFTEINEDVTVLTRKLSEKSSIYTHFHSAVFSYQPLKKDVQSLNEVVHTLFENNEVLSVMHLVNDERDINGVGQSEYNLGYVWAGEIVLDNDKDMVKK